MSHALVMAIHSRQLAEHGGQVGVRDEGLLESALAAPKNRYAYENCDVISLAATYAFSICRNHPFLDGNKRTALVTAGVFLELNGHRLEASEPAAAQAVLDLAAGDFDAAGFETWLRESTASADT